LNQTGAESSGVSIPSTKVLVAEDFEPYRALILSLLKENSQFSVIFEVANGILAIEKAQQLKPDLLLLDVGLPGLNGIECARRIRETLPDVKIVFLSQETSPEVIQEALSVGSCGYVVKSRAGDELLDAIQAVLEGKSHISEGFV
jgi:DNA-binding NarL/FixJ family response regulator